MFITLLAMTVLLRVENVRRLYVDVPPSSVADLNTVALPGDVIVCQATGAEWTIKSGGTLATGAGGSSGAGDTGPQGPQGLQGIQGPAGADGAAGSQGIQGIQGNDGAAGAQGPQGLQGDAGLPGADGNAGAQGIQGVPGNDGAQGPQGIQGIQGIQGPQGDPGSVSACWPIGSVFTSVVATDPATLLGFGTWAALGAGRVLVGFDAGQTEFDTLKETGGAKTHTLLTTEIPAHTHVQDAHTHTYASQTATTGGASSYEHGAIDTSSAATESSISVNAATAVNQNAGGGGAHNNLQPYLVVRFWERTA